MKPKPDCTGQRFGFLTVTGKFICEKTNRTRWVLLCDCGKTIDLIRGDFDCKTPRQISCGCARHRKNKPVRIKQNITNQRFDKLTVVKLSGKRDSNKQPTWVMQCDCGQIIERSLKRLNINKKHGWRNNCGDINKHHENRLWYPPMPNPMPGEVGLLIEKYLGLCQLKYSKIKQCVEDRKFDRLLRCCWIIVYRRWQGEKISELHEARIIKKHLRYAPIDTFRVKKLENNGGLYYDISNTKRTIGDAMTKLTLSDYPVLELPKTQGNKILSRKKLKFKRY